MITIHLNTNELYNRMYHLRGEPHTYVAYVRGQRCTTYERLHAEISAALQFPSYYGENLNALSECIEDLEWLNAERIFIFIDQAENFLQFDEAEDNAYSKILICAEKYWQEESKEFVVFLNIGKNWFCC